MMQAHEGCGFCDRYIYGFGWTRKRALKALDLAMADHLAAFHVDELMLAIKRGFEENGWGVPVHTWDEALEPGEISGLVGFYNGCAVVVDEDQPEDMPLMLERATKEST